MGPDEYPWSLRSTIDVHSGLECGTGARDDQGLRSPRSYLPDSPILLLLQPSTKDPTTFGPTESGSGGPKSPQRLPQRVPGKGARPLAQQEGEQLIGPWREVAGLPAHAQLAARAVELARPEGRDLGITFQEFRNPSE